jgi:acetyl esterase
MTRHTLEPAAQEIANATSKPPFLYELGPDSARKVLDDIQAAPSAKLYVEETWITVPAEVGDVPVRIVKPAGAAEDLPAVLYLHGGGWILGNADTHDRLVREFAIGTEAALVFVEYDRSPEAQYPVAIEQAYATARWIVRHGDTQGLDRTRLAVAVPLLPGHRRRPGHRQLPRVRQRSLPHRQSHGVVLGRLPARPGKAVGNHRIAPAGKPGRARRAAGSIRDRRRERRDENDVLRDEGEAYARKLAEAGVRTTSVRFNGTIHDFLMLNPLRGTAATTAALGQAINVLRKALGTR